MNKTKFFENDDKFTKQKAGDHGEAHEGGHAEGHGSEGDHGEAHHGDGHHTEKSLREVVADKRHIHLHAGAMEFTVLAF